MQLISRITVKPVKSVTALSDIIAQYSSLSVNDHIIPQIRHLKKQSFNSYIKWSKSPLQLHLTTKQTMNRYRIIRLCFLEASYLLIFCRNKHLLIIFISMLMQIWTND